MLSFIIFKDYFYEVSDNVHSVISDFSNFNPLYVSLAKGLQTLLYFFKAHSWFY
jgi:hypothetical protein